ncbi:MAG: alpha/beta hydrolase [Patiriisocius sp.]|uniref:alpha/beta hydrolase n=1 Tax=Patiriisocius sp. TaxID=2822396 RepID=UPI003EF60DB0
MKKIIKRALIALTGLILLISIGTAVMYFKQEDIVFAATSLDQDYTFDFDISFEEVRLTAENDVSLHGIHFKVENPKGVILYFHGNSGDLSRWGHIASYFTTLQYDVLVVDYRTYGKSTGSIDEQKMLDDTQLWYNYLLKSNSEKDIIIYGRSIGTGFATYLASKNKPRKVILETPFYNLKDVAKQKFSWIPFLDSLLKIKLTSNIYVKNITSPIVIYHGTNDAIVDYKSGEKLATQIPKKQLTFITIPNATHHNIGTFAEYTSTIEESLK